MQIFLWGRAAGIATGYGLDGRGVGVRVSIGARFVLHSTSSSHFLRPIRPRIQWVPGLFPRGKAAGA
jgi:hypothetical protein